MTLRHAVVPLAGLSLAFLIAPRRSRYVVQSPLTQAELEQHFVVPAFHTEAKQLADAC